MSDTIPDISALLDRSLNQSPADTAAALASASGVDTNAAAAGADPEQVDPQTSVDPGDPYEMQPDSEVSLPEQDPEPAAPTAQPVDLAPLFKQGEDDYAAAYAAAQEAAQWLADLQNNAEGIVGFTPEVADAMQAKMRTEAEAERAFNEIGDDAIMSAIEQFPELRDDNHPATIAIKNLLETDPALASRSPTAVADLSVKIAQQIRTASASQQRTASQPKPTPGPVPPKTPAPAAAMQSHRQATAPAPGQPRTPDIVAQVAQAAQAGSLADLIEKTLGSAGPSIRMS